MVKKSDCCGKYCCKHCTICFPDNGEIRMTKRMPLLILGKRVSGKSSALLQIAKLSNATLIAPNLNMVKNLADNTGLNYMSGAENHEIKLSRTPETELCIDEFSRCDHIPESNQIVALTDDINNFPEIIKKLGELGYNCKMRVV